MALFYTPPLTKQEAYNLQKEMRLNHHVVYPLSAKGKTLGVVVFGLHKTFSKLDSSEKDLLQAFTEEAGIAIENAQLYEQVQEKAKQLRRMNERLRELDQLKDE